MKLVIWQDNWADEMDVSGWWAITENELDEQLTYLRNVPAEDWASKRYYSDEKFYLDALFEYHIGTNESIGYASYEDLAKTITVVDLSFQEYTSLQNLFGASRFGLTDVLEQAVEFFEDPEGDWEDDDLLYVEEEDEDA